MPDCMALTNSDKGYIVYLWTYASRRTAIKNKNIFEILLDSVYLACNTF